MLQVVNYRMLDFLGFPGYRVGDDGSVWTQRRTGGGMRTTWRELTPDKGRYGHRRVLLMPGRKRFLVHHLVLTAFVGPCPDGMECRHFPDRNPANNRLENLQWGTRTENQRDRCQHGTDNRGTGNPSSKLTPDAVHAIRNKRKSGATLNAIASEFGVTLQTIHAITTGKTWGHIT